MNTGINKKSIKICNEDIQIVSACIEVLRRNNFINDVDIKVNEQLLNNEKKLRVYHNTSLLLKKYRKINWAIKDDLSSIVENETNTQISDIDKIIDGLYNVLDLQQNSIIEKRLQEICKTRSILFWVEDAVNKLKDSPNGDMKHKIIYSLYIDGNPKRNQKDIWNLFHISRTYYYKIKSEAIEDISLILWLLNSEKSDLIQQLLEKY